jgi:hypothetical protein
MSPPVELATYSIECEASAVSVTPKAVSLRLVASGLVVLGLVVLGLVVPGLVGVGIVPVGRSGGVGPGGSTMGTPDADDDDDNGVTVSAPGAKLIV